MARRPQNMWRSLASEFAKAMIVLALFVASFSASSFSAYAMDQDQYLNGGAPVIFCGGPIGSRHTGATCGLCTLGVDVAARPKAPSANVILSLLTAYIIDAELDRAPSAPPIKAYHGRAPPFAV